MVLESVSVKLETIQNGKPHGICEDTYGLLHTGHSTVAIVADGTPQRLKTTTSLQRLLAEYGDGTTPGLYAANLTRTTVLAHLAADENASLKDALIAANDALRAKVQPIFGQLDAASVLKLEPGLAELRSDPRLVRLMLPVCVTTVARIRWAENRLDFAHCGDTMLIAFYRDGRVEPLTRDQMGQHDERALRVALQVQAETGAAHLSDVLLDERVVAANRANGIYHNFEDQDGHPDPAVGVGTINGLPQLSAYIQEGSLGLNDIAALIVCSDGFPLPAPLDESDEDRNARFTRLRMIVDQQGLDAYVNALRAEERADSTRDRYPRFALHDDVTAIYLRL